MKQILGGVTPTQVEYSAFWQKTWRGGVQVSLAIWQRLSGQSI